MALAITEMELEISTVGSDRTKAGEQECLEKDLAASTMNKPLLRSRKPITP